VCACQMIVLDSFLDVQRMVSIGVRRIGGGSVMRKERRGMLRYALVLVMLALTAGFALLPPSDIRAATLVTTCNDSGAGSLRDAINTAPGGSTITFQPGLNCSSTGSGPITLTSGTLTIATNLTIDGTGATIVVDGGCTLNRGGTSCTGAGVTV